MGNKVKAPESETWKLRRDPHTWILTLSHVLSFVLFIVPLVYLFLLFYVPIGIGVDPVEIYVRNISSIVAIFLTGMFFQSYYLYHTHNLEQFMRTLDIVTICLAVAGIIKVIVSIYYLIICISNGNVILWFYVSEILIWAAITLFAIFYRRKGNAEDVL